MRLCLIHFRLFFFSRPKKTKEFIRLRLTPRLLLLLYISCCNVVGSFRPIRIFEFINSSKKGSNPLFRQLRILYTSFCTAVVTTRSSSSSSFVRSFFSKCSNSSLRQLLHHHRRYHPQSSLHILCV